MKKIFIYAISNDIGEFENMLQVDPDDVLWEAKNDNEHGVKRMELFEPGGQTTTYYFIEKLVVTIK